MEGILNNKLFEAFANASDQIYVYVSDMERGITRWSKNAVEYFSLPGEYIEDAAEVWGEYVHPDDREGYLSDIMAVLNRTSAHHNCQYRARNRYGKYVWMECKGSVIFDKDGRPGLFAGIMTRLDNQNKYDPVTHLLTSYELVRYEFDNAGAVMLVGIDEFRKINSSHGFSYGNEILVYLAEKLTECCERAVVYRFIGDEFVVFGEDMNAAEMERIFAKAKSICNNADKENGIAPFSITAGILEYNEEEETAAILAKAEICYDYAKENKPGEYTIYSEEIEQKISRKNMIAETLLDCIKDDFKGFRLVYQPIVANTGDTVVACEALLRWKSDNELIGNCYPDEFISILEGNGGMKAVGYFVMREAIRQAAEWQKKYKSFNVSFNVSYVQLEDSEFVPAIIDAIEEYGADPEKIVVELTESVLSVDTVKVKQSFKILREKGIKIALDDFGTGNSSFWMLHNIDVDIVKLDQSFIRKLDAADTEIDRAIVESVGIMCSRIGYKTVAEGIETERIWKMVCEYGFTGLQGYFFSRPVEVDEFEAFLQRCNMEK